MTQTLYDPTGETAPAQRARQVPPSNLDGKTVMLFDIGKTRSDEFLDHLDELLSARGLKTARVAKPTNAKTAPKEVIERIVTEADVVVEALSD
jgi:hypothetical protein